MSIKLACLACGQLNRIPDAAPGLHLPAKSPTGSALEPKRDRMTFQDE